MTRTLPAGLIVACVTLCALAPTTADARKAKHADKPAPKQEKTTAGGKLVETYGDWTTSLAQGKTKTCYALTQPKKRSTGDEHGKAYVFIADRPADKVHNEVSIMMGFPIKEGSAAKAKVGRKDFDLVGVSNAFFMKDASEEGQFVEALKHGGALVVKASPAKGSAVVDTYSLNGVKPALERAQKECR